MKMPTYTPRAVESQGTHDAGAVRRQAHAIAGVSNTQAQVMNHMAKVSADFIERKEKMEDLTARTNVVVKTGAWTQENSVKEYWSAEEVRELGLQDKVRTTDDMTMTDGSTEQVDRERIPKFEVYHFAQSQFLEGLVNNEVKLLSNNIDINNFNSSMGEMKSEMTLRSGLEAAQEQRKYLHAEGVNNYQQAAVTGNLPLALDLIEEGPFTDIEKRKFTLDANQTVEWGNDSDLLDNSTMPIEAKIEYMKQRLAQLEDPGYLHGKPMEFDESGVPKSQYSGYFGRDKNDGPLNREAAIKRFKSAIDSETGRDNRDSTRDFRESMESLYTGKAQDLVTPDYIDGRNWSDAVKEDAHKTYIEANKVYEFVKDREMNSAQQDTVASRKAMEMSGGLNEFERQKIEQGLDRNVRYKTNAIKADQLTYILQNDDMTADAFAEMNSVRGTSAYPAALKKFVSHATNSAARLSGYTQEIELISTGQSQAIKRALESTEEGGPEAASKISATLQGLQDEWQEHWPIVHRQLLKEGSLTRAQSVASNMGPMDLALSNELLRSANIPVKDIKAQIGPEDYKDVSDNIDGFVANSLETFNSTMVSENIMVAGGTERIAEYREAVTLVAMARAARGVSVDQDVVDQIANDMINKHYNYVEDTNGNYRVPITAGDNGRVLDRRSIEAAAVLQRVNIHMKDIYIQSIYQDEDGEDKTRVQRQSAEILRTSGVWKNYGSDSGLEFLFPTFGTNLEGQSVLIKNEDGSFSPMQYTWEELEEMGAPHVEPTDPDEARKWRQEKKARFWEEDEARREAQRERLRKEKILIEANKNK